MKWQNTVTNPDEVKVFTALGEPYTWRTTGGISRDTGLSEEKVRAIVTKYHASLTRLADTPSISGLPLVGLIENVGT